MHRIVTFLLMIFLFGTTHAEAARTVVTSRPAYRPYYNNRPMYHHRHNYYNRRPNYYYNPAINNRRIYTPSPLQRRYYNNGYLNQVSSFSDLSSLEKYALNKSFSRESDLDRLQRLEMQAFGAIQQGDINTRYDNVRSAILSRPKQNYKTSWLRNLGNYFSGQMTGFTPPIGTSNYIPYTTSFNPVNPYNSWNNFNYNQYPTVYDNGRSYGWGTSPFNRGYRTNNYSTGSTTGVKIID